MMAYVHEGLRYAVASVAAFVVDMCVLWALVHFLSWNYLAAAAFSFLAGTVVAYILSVKVVFSRRKFRNHHAGFASFAAIGTAGLAVNAAVLFLAVRYWGIYYLVAKGIAAGFTLICNFVARRKLLFTSSNSL